MIKTKNQHPYKRESMAGFLTAEEPLEVVGLIQG